MVTRRAIELDLLNLSHSSCCSVGVTVAGEQIIEQIEKQRAGSITSIDQEIRKLKTELYLETINNRNSISNNSKQQQKKKKKQPSTSADVEKQSRRFVHTKVRINTKEAAIMEKQRLDNIVAHIKTKP